MKCQLLAQSGYFTTEFQCPLLGVKRTFLQAASMSAFDPKRTFVRDIARELSRSMSHLVIN